MLRLSILLCAAIAALGQTAPQTVLLWPDGAPGAHGDSDADKPALTLYPASGAKKIDVGIVVCPGGSYHNLAMDHEGTQVAEWLNERGISAFVLRYRLGPKYHFPIELSDAQRAIRYVRSHASEFGIRRNRVGIWVFRRVGILLPPPGRISIWVIAMQVMPSPGPVPGPTS